MTVLLLYICFQSQINLIKNKLNHLMLNKIKLVTQESVRLVCLSSPDRLESVLLTQLVQLYSFLFIFFMSFSLQVNLKVDINLYAWVHGSSVMKEQYGWTIAQMEVGKRQTYKTREI